MDTTPKDSTQTQTTGLGFQSSDQAALNGTLQQVVDLFINPEIKRRLDAGEIKELPIGLWAAQVIFPGDGSPPKVRLNREIRGSAIATVTPETPTTSGTTLDLEQMEVIEKFKLSEPEDLDAGHVTVVWLKDKRVFLAFDFRYNKSLAGELVSVSEQFLDGARTAKDVTKHWPVFVENLFSSLELSVKAFLWTSPWGFKFRPRMSHTEIRSTFATFPLALNKMTGTADALESLAKERNTAPYLHGEIVPDWGTAEQWFKEAQGMLDRATAQVASGFKEPIIEAESQTPQP